MVSGRESSGFFDEEIEVVPIERTDSLVEYYSLMLNSLKDKGLISEKNIDLLVSSYRSLKCKENKFYDCFKINYGNSKFQLIPVYEATSNQATDSFIEGMVIGKMSLELYNKGYENFFTEDLDEILTTYTLLNIDETSMIYCFGFHNLCYNYDINFQSDFFEKILNIESFLMHNDVNYLSSRFNDALYISIPEISNYGVCNGGNVFNLETILESISQRTTDLMELEDLSLKINDEKIANRTKQILDECKSSSFLDLNLFDED
jgi:hypothetical protein